MRPTLNRPSLVVLAAGVCLVVAGLAGGCRAHDADAHHALIDAEWARVGPARAMSREAVEAGLAHHDRALFVKTGWIRDPYITIGPDGRYYLTGTTPNPGDPRNQTEPYNSGLDWQEQELRNRPSIVGWKVRVWTSDDLIDWVELDPPFDLTDGYWAQQQPGAFGEDADKSDWRLWAPEVHFINGKWHVVHTTPTPVRGGSNLAVTAGDRLAGPYTFPLGDEARWKHDPSLFVDAGTVYMLWGNTMIAPLKDDLSGFTREPVRIDPSGTRPNPDKPGQTIRHIGHEGATMIKVGGTFIHFGTAWSTDKMRRGSYNLYYCASDDILGPYGERQFAGRFLGHGTPFRDKQGRWWCTAFYNANVPPLPYAGIEQRDIGETANTINPQGVTIVPLEVRTLDDGSVFIRAKDPAYRNPGPDEAQVFASVD